MAAVVNTGSISPAELPLLHCFFFWSWFLCCLVVYSIFDVSPRLVETGNFAQYVIHVSKYLTVFNRQNVLVCYFQDILFKCTEFINPFCWQPAMHDKSNSLPGISLGDSATGLHLPDRDLTDECNRLKEVCNKSPLDVKSWSALALAHKKLGDIDSAINCCERLRDLAPRAPAVHYNLGVIYTEKVLLEAAKNSYEEAIRLRPEYISAHINLGMIYASCGDVDKAFESYRAALSVDPEHVATNVHLGALLIDRGKPDEAKDYFNKAISLDPENIDLVVGIATYYQFAGIFNEAFNLISPIFNSETDHPGVAIIYGILSRRFNLTGVATQRMEDILSVGALTSESRRSLHFNLGDLLDYENKYADAFKHYSKGNSLSATHWNILTVEHEFDASISTYTREFMESAPRSRLHDSEVRPIFIVGMPRSGTTLVEQILASHPEIEGAGEVPYIKEALACIDRISGGNQKYPFSVKALSQHDIDTLSSTYMDRMTKFAGKSTRFVTDKVPGNYFYLGLIETMFPQSLVIHCKRDPLDACLSCYFKNFVEAHHYSHTLEYLGHYHRQYERLMQHWAKTLRIPIIALQYEDLVNDSAGKIGELLDFCGLEWNDHCVNFHTNKRLVTTPSYDQVRQPMYNSSVGKWRNYKEFVQPLCDSLRIDVCKKNVDPK